MFPHTHCLETVLHSLPDLFCGDADVLRPESYVFFDDLRYDLIVRILEDHSRLSANLPEILLILGIESVHPYCSLCGEKQRVKMFGQC